MSDLSSSGRLHGRALAQERRRQQAQQKQGGQGKVAAARAAAPKSHGTAAAGASVSPGAQVQSEVQAARPRGPQAAAAQRARRSALAPRGSDPAQRDDGRQAVQPTEGITVSAAGAGTVAEATERLLDTVCEVAEAGQGAFGARDNSVRKLCKARRRSLAERGKVAATVVQGLMSAVSRQRYLETGSAREFARLHRQEQAKRGRGADTPSRPTGRERSRKYKEPQKVEVGTTLAGSAVTGTQVDRTPAVTGIESGSCRTITGTEYLGSEHYGRFCDTVPARSPEKVHAGHTGRGVGVTGTYIGRAPAMTGDEAGACRPVTGMEYYSSDSFRSLCKTEPPVRSAKVAVGVTARRQLPVSGSDEARANRVTGAEAGTAAKVTGSQYADAGGARLTINGPRKVADTHTLSGRPVSGTAVDGTNRITGLEPGQCRTVTGTEYLSQETFASLCRTRPEPTEPPKVEETLTDRRQRITGNLVDRSEKVTGNEPGSCLRLTGTGYSSSTLCGGDAAKVQTMTTLAGTAVKGTGFDKLPKTTGDERGGCWPVTGTNYHGREHYAHCASTPQAGARKVDVTRTDRGQLVSGPALGPHDAVTGNEAGGALSVTGTPYAGQEVQIMSGHGVQEARQGHSAAANAPHGAGGCGCNCKDRIRELENRLQQMQNPAVSAHSPAGSTRFVGVAPAPARQEAPVVPAAFSVTPPAQEGRSRITGAGGGQNGRITGPVNLARGLVTGTPEFRARETVATMPVAVEAAEEPSTPVAGAWRITGDDWSRGERVTGTEGHWAQRRNPTQRGAARTCVMSASVNKGQPLAAPVPEGRITGSSGSSQKGSVVTYSGGARG